MSAIPFLTVSLTFRALPSAPPGKTWTSMRPPESCFRRSAKALAPMSISGPPAQPVAIFHLHEPALGHAVSSAATADGALNSVPSARVSDASTTPHFFRILCLPLWLYCAQSIAPRRNGTCHSLFFSSRQTSQRTEPYSTYTDNILVVWFLAVNRPLLPNGMRRRTHPGLHL